MTKIHKQFKLNIGCGTDILPGFVNIDARDDVGADLVQDINTPLPFPENSVTEILAQDIFEHLTLTQQESLLKQLYRLMSVGGKLRLRVPNLEDIWDRFSADPDTRNLFLYGNTSQSGVWGAHKSGHTLISLWTLAKSQGFEMVKYQAINTNYEIEFKKTFLPTLKGVIFINQSLGMGGAEQFNLQLLSWLKGQNVPVSAYVAQKEFVDQLRSANLPVQKIPLIIDLIGDWKGLLKGFLLFPLGIIYYTKLVLTTKDQGTYFLTGFIEKILVTPVAKLFGQPVVWVEFGPLQFIFSKFFGLPKILYKLVSQLPDYVVEPTENTFTQNVSITNLSHARTIIIPCAINGLNPKSSQQIPFSVYSVSRLEPGKGQDLLISAWPHVLQKFPQAKLFFIGGGNFLASLKSQVQKLHLSDSITFLGQVEDMAKAIAPYSIGVFPSVWPLEGFGLVVLEAMSAKKPIICSNLGPYPEIVDKSTALLVDPRNSSELSQAIIKLMTDSKLAKSLGSNAQKRFRLEFTWDKIGPEYMEILKRAQIRAQVIQRFTR